MGTRETHTRRRDWLQQERAVPAILLLSIWIRDYMGTRVYMEAGASAQTCG